MTHCLKFVGNDDEGGEEVKSKPAKAKAKPTKKPILPDSLRASQKVIPACSRALTLPHGKHYHMQLLKPCRAKKGSLEYHSASLLL